MKLARLFWVLVVAGVSAMLASCGGGGGGAGSISGRIADGYINGAIVFWDCNDNLIIDGDEAINSVISGQSGAYRIAASPAASCILRAYVPATAIDEDTNTAVGSGMMMSSIAGKPELVTPLTTLVGAGGMTEDELNKKLTDAGSLLSISKDYIAAGDAGIQNHNAAKYVAQTLKVITGQIRVNDVSQRQATITSAIGLLPNAAWVSKTVLPQSTLDNFFEDVKGISQINSMSAALGTPSFVINESGFTGAENPRLRPAVQAALDLVKMHPEIVTGPNIRWGALSQTDLSTFAPLLSDRSVLPETQSVKDILSVLQQNTQNAIIQMDGSKNQSLQDQSLTFINSVTDASVTSISSALVLFPAANYIKKAAAYPLNIKKIKLTISTLKKMEKFQKMAGALPDCLDAIERIEALDFSPDIIITDIADDAVLLAKCATGVLSDNDFKLAVKVLSGLNAASKGISKTEATDAANMINFISAFDDVVSTVLDIAELSVPKAIFDELDLIIVKPLKFSQDQNDAADKADEKMQVRLNDIYTAFKNSTKNTKEVLIAARLAPYIRLVATSCAAGYSLSNGVCLPNPTISSITPPTATVGQSITFTIAGTNLPTASGLDVTVNGCANIAFSMTTVNLHKFACTPQAVGTITVIARAVSGGVVLKSQDVVVTSGATLLATNFVRGSHVGVNVEGYGPNLLLNSPPTEAAANSAEWDFSISKSGTYEVFTSYAAALSRPAIISINGNIVFSPALTNITGGWFEQNVQEYSEGRVTLSAGANVLRISRSNVFPHIRSIRFVYVN